MHIGVGPCVAFLSHTANDECGIHHGSLKGMGKTVGDTDSVDNWNACTRISFCDERDNFKN